MQIVKSVLILASLALTIPCAGAAELESRIARGGRLYDKWFAENKTPAPQANHPLYPADGKYGKSDSWRCKECHGWDYMGKDGAYSKGGHATGIKGITAAAGKDPLVIQQLLRAPAHGYTATQLSDRDVEDLALFVTRGQIDTKPYVDPATNKVKGDAAKGEIYFNTVCAGCHGLDGKKIDTGEPLGAAAGNGVEMLHKVLNGQPAENMPAMRAFDTRISADLAAHLQTLPK
ncbi:MAG: c-type cytochrome [Beijerinckiaceae bacterium]